MQIASKDRLFDILVENIDLGIAIVDRNGYFIFYNQVMSEIEGLDDHDVLGEHLFNAFPFINEENSTIYKCLNKGIPIYNDFQSYINKKGRKIFSLVTDIPIKTGNEVVGVIEIAMDINRVKKTYKPVDDWLNKSNNNIISTEANESIYYNFDDFIPCDKSMIELINKVKRMAKYDSNVLIYGETGTGKEIFAQSIHNLSRRRNKQFIAQNCAAIPENLLESIFFGTEKGSFTGAMDKEGLFEQANGGTLLLDELNSLPVYL